MSELTFEDQFDQLMARKRQEMWDKYHRVLPSGEIIYNRFDKAKDLGYGEGSSVYDTSVIMGDIEVGKHVWIGPFTLLEGSSAKLTIGDYVSIDSGVQIYTHDSTKNYISGGQIPFEKGDVEIGSNTVIGSMTIIMCNSKIGSHCVIAAHSFVKGNVEDNSIVAGCPAKVIGKVSVDKENRVSFIYFK